MENDEEIASVAKRAFPDRSNRGAAASEPTPRWVIVFGVVAGALFLCFVVLHLTGHGLGHHGRGSQAAGHIESNSGKHP